MNTRRYVQDDYPIVPLDGPEFAEINYVTGQYEAIAPDDISCVATEEVDPEGADVRDTLHKRQPILDPRRYPTQNTRQGKIILRRKPANRQLATRRPDYAPETTGPSMFWLRLKIAFFTAVLCTLFVLLLCLFIIVPAATWAKNHWEYGGSIPTSYAGIEAKNQDDAYFVEASWLPTNKVGQGQVVLNMIPKDPQHHKGQAFMIPTAGIGDYHVITVKAIKGANGAKNRIQSYIDGVPGPSLVQNDNGFAIEN